MDVERFHVVCHYVVIGYRYRYIIYKIIDL